MKLVIAGPVGPSHRNTFELLVNFMHGDADHYTKEHYFFYDVNEKVADSDFTVAHVITFVSWYIGEKKLNHNSSQLRRLLQGKRGGYGTVEDMHGQLIDVAYEMDVWPPDITYVDHLAQPQWYRLFWYDIDGNKFYVEVG